MLNQRRNPWTRRAGLVAALAVSLAIPSAVADGSVFPEATARATFTAVADTYSAQDDRSSNFGSEPTLINENRPGHVHRSYLRFVVSGIPADATVERASLRMTALADSPATANVKVVTGDWAEDQLTGATAPAYNPTRISDGDPSPVAAGTVSFDVTDVVKGDGTWNLVLTQTQAARTVWSSREGFAPPQLDIEYVPAAAPSPEPTPSVSPTPTPDGPPPTPGPQPFSQAPCAGGAPPTGGYRHVVWILEENEAQSTIGGSNMPYMTGLAGRCGRTSNLQAITHPSLPNYIALTSGDTQGVNNDDPPSHWSNVIGGAPSLFSQLGTDWTALQEGMPSNCALSSGGDRYAVRHNPAAYYLANRSACASRDVPYNSGQTPDISRAFTFITPNLCNDAHDCSLRTADDWLTTVVPKILDSPTYQGGDTLLVITFDEGVGADQTVYTTIVAPSVSPGTVSAGNYTHYSTLRATEELLGLPLLGRAGSAASWAGDFNLR
ncbi:MAG: phosphatidylinositol-3-phosphatase [Solirubrobacteraceae bacterium]|jgi:hypothetical protein|nr:phosphatidylinositol-3-phosphatase [Solirubrobacteraceae bacterium]